MRLLIIVLACFMLVGLENESRAQTTREGNDMNPLVGKTIRWIFRDGPVAGIQFEHTFQSDGTVIWRALDGAMKDASVKEKQYAVVKIATDIYAVSYLAASGHTLSVVLNFQSKQMTGFGSNEKQWYSMNGTFEIPK